MAATLVEIVSLSVLLYLPHLIFIYITITKVFIPLVKEIRAIKSPFCRILAVLDTTALCLLVTPFALCILGICSRIWRSLLQPVAEETGVFDGMKPYEI